MLLKSISYDHEQNCHARGRGCSTPSLPPKFRTLESTSGPITAANAASELMPKTDTAKAIASSKRKVSDLCERLHITFVGRLFESFIMGIIAGPPVRKKRITRTNASARKTMLRTVV